MNELVGGALAPAQPTPGVASDVEGRREEECALAARLEASDPGGRHHERLLHHVVELGLRNTDARHVAS